jgi:hypothetical protein
MRVQGRQDYPEDNPKSRARQLDNGDAPWALLDVISRRRVAELAGEERNRRAVGRLRWPDP